MVMFDSLDQNFPGWDQHHELQTSTNHRRNPTANHRFPHRQDRVVRSLLPGALPTRPAALRGRRAVAHRAADAKQVAGRVDGLGGGLCAGRAQEAGWGKLGKTWVFSWGAYVEIGTESCCSRKLNELWCMNVYI